MIAAAALVAGCEAPSVGSPERARLLADSEMDQISAGSADATSNVVAYAQGPAPQTTASTSTRAVSGSPVSAPPFLNLVTLNYAFSQAVAAAADAPLTAASGSTHLGVDGGSGGASINAAGMASATGSSAGSGQVSMQFYGLSIGQGVDLVFGTAVAAACCAPLLAAQATADGAGGGYWRALQASPVSDVPGQVQGRVDISVVSSALPILNAGQVSALTGPALSQSVGQ